MSRLEDCCWSCAECGRIQCGDDGDDCGHDDQPICRDCCPRLHADERIREALRDWGRTG